MNVVFDAFESGDVIVVGSPVYFDTVSAQTKLMIDRSNCLMPLVKRGDGSSGFYKRLKKRKMGVFIAVAGMGQEFKTILTTIRGFFKWTNTELVETILYSYGDNDLGSVVNDGKVMTRAFKVGARIAGQEKKSKLSK